VRCRINRNPAQSILQLTDQLGRDARKIVDEIERVLDFVRNAGGELPERGQLLGLHKAVLCGAKFLERLREVGRALAQLIEQARVLNGDDRLRGKRLCKFDLFAGERPYGSALQDEYTNWTPSRRSGTPRLVR